MNIAESEKFKPCPVLAACIHLTRTKDPVLQELSRNAMNEHRRVSEELAELKRQLKNNGPRFQGMTDLA